MFNFRLHIGILKYQCKCIMLLRFIIVFLENENQYRTTVTLNRMVNIQEGVKKNTPELSFNSNCVIMSIHHSTYSPYRI